MKARLISGSLIVAAILPFSANALSIGDLQQQITGLLSQIAQLQAQPSVSVQSGSATACTMEAKQCPDGSYVGRAGPNCEFAPCQGGGVPSRICPQILRGLSLSARGSDVSDLQNFLRDEGVFDGNVTAFFGPVTMRAVQTWQAQNGISAVGSVGPQTRAAIARRCGNPQSGNFSASPTYGAAPLAVNFTYAPKTEDSGQYYIEFGDGQGQIMATQQIYCIRAPCISPSAASHTYTQSGTYTATVSRYIACLYSNPRCMMAQPAPLASATITVTDGSTTGLPSISGVNGPTSLSVGQSGTWSVHVNDSSGYLSYSVRWGDETPMPLMYGTASAPIASSGTFTHTYATAGSYTPTFTVTNGNGQSASASATVVVSGLTSQTFSASPTYGAAPLDVSFVISVRKDSYVPYGNSGYSVDFGDGQQADVHQFISEHSCDDPHYCLIGDAPHSYTKEGTYVAKLINNGQTIDSFTVTVKGIAPPPTLSKVYTSPTFESIYIEGTDFRSSNTIHIGSVYISSPGYNSASNFQTETLAFFVPVSIKQLPAGSQIPVTVSTDAGRSNAVTFTVPGSNDIKTYPTISSFEPLSGPVGTRITLHGSGFSTTGNSVDVGSGAAVVNATSADGSTLSFILPNKVSGCPYQVAPNCQYPDQDVKPGNQYGFAVQNKDGLSNGSGSTLFTVTTVTITVTSSQSGTFSTSPTSGPAPLAVTFSVNAQDSSDSSGVYYTIVYGDGQAAGFSRTVNPSLTHTYSSAGAYTATVTKRIGCSAWECVGSATMVGTVTITAW